MIALFIGIHMTKFVGLHATVYIRVTIFISATICSITTRGKV